MDNYTGRRKLTGSKKRKNNKNNKKLKNKANAMKKCRENVTIL